MSTVESTSDSYPLGLRPERIAEYHAMRDRVIEIMDAMSRYADAGKPTPPEWVNELSRRLDSFMAMQSRRNAQ